MDRHRKPSLPAANPAGPGRASLLLAIAGLLGSVAAPGPAMAQETASTGTIVVKTETVPAGAGGTASFRGVPRGTVNADDGTIVVADLTPGSYTTTLDDPASELDLSDIRCDDGASATVTTGDVDTRTVVFELDPGETVMCTFVLTRRGTIVVKAETEGEGGDAQFTFEGVPEGTVSPGAALVNGDLAPGTYRTVMAEPGVGLELEAIACDDGGSPSVSQGSLTARTAEFRLDPGETVTCTFILGSAGESGATDRSGEAEEPGPWGPDATDPFEDPDRFLDDFPLPGTLPTSVGPFIPRSGPWFATDFGGTMTCGTGMSMSLHSGPAGSGDFQVLDGGRVIEGTGVGPEGPVDLRLTAVPGVLGRYEGTAETTTDMGPVELRYTWQVVTPEYVLGHIGGAMAAQGMSCELNQYSEFEFTGDTSGDGR